MEDRRNVGESSCNFGDGTDQRVQSLMFMMMKNSGGAVHFKENTYPFYRLKLSTPRLNFQKFPSAPRTISVSDPRSGHRTFVCRHQVQFNNNSRSAIAVQPVIMILISTHIAYPPPFRHLRDESRY